VAADLHGPAEDDDIQREYQDEDADDDGINRDRGGFGRCGDQDESSKGTLAGRSGVDPVATMTRPACSRVSAPPVPHR
jgi:hypothetical protein